MPTIKLTVLTPVHIGTGREYAKPEYVFNTEGNKIIIIDDEKLLNQIPAKDRQREMGTWVADISRGYGVNNLLQRCGIRDKQCVAKKIIDIQQGADIEVNKGSIREQIYTGGGKPYIPGSSLKGAMVSALLGAQATNISIDDIYETNKRKYKDNKLIEKYFGKINEDNDNTILRFLQVGDSMFNEGDTEIQEIKGFTLHGTPKEPTWAKKTSRNGSLTNLIEVIKPGTTATCRINDKETCFKDKQNNIQRQILQSVQETKLSVIDSIKNIFSKINMGTKKTIEGHFDKIGFEDDSTNKEYLNKFDSYITEINSLPSTTCILRVGWGGGYDFVTGGWQGALPENDRNDLYKSLARGRPIGNNEFPFPKSIRMTLEGYPLGFVKLEVGT